MGDAWPGSLVANLSSPFSRLFGAQHQPSLAPPSTYPARKRRSRLLFTFYPRPLKASPSNKLRLTAKAGRTHAPQPIQRQLSESALGSSLSKLSPLPRLPPWVRVAERVRTLARWLPVFFAAAAVRREGRGCFFWSPAPLGRASLQRLRAPARSPSWNWEEEGEGDPDKTRVVVLQEAETEEERGRGLREYP